MEKNRKKGKPEKSGQNMFLRFSVGNPRRGVDLRLSVGCPRRGEAKVPKRAPLRVRYSLAWLRHGEGLHHGGGLRRNVAVLRRGVDTVHSKKFLYFCFRTPRISTPIV